MTERTQTKLSEQDLAKLLVKHDRNAVSLIYDKYADSLYGVILRIVKSEETAEDLLQETFVKIWQNASSYDSTKGKLFTWLLNIARNLAIDKLRSRDYRDTMKNRELTNHVSIIDEERKAVFNPDQIGVKELMSALKPEYQSILDLVYFKGYTHSEASEKLNIPLGTVKTRVRASINYLRKFFKIKE